MKKEHERGRVEVFFSLSLSSVEFETHVKLVVGWAFSFFRGAQNLKAGHKVVFYISFEAQV